ncbi:MAG: sigma 54-interacting transcriptional regulator [Planctomycetota bacterium]|nr:sigma 54-interacting transcriptional regulator [Planctomycetota bacterium]
MIRDGTKWSDVFRLVPGRTVTIGRAPTNQIVIKEEQASRHHAEIFLAEGKWMVRDLESRNGTAVGSDRMHGDHLLKPGDVVRIAKTQLAFVHDLSQAYEDSGVNPVQWGQETAVGLEMEGPADQNSSGTSEAIEPTTITHRRGETRFLKDESDSQSSGGIAAARLFRLSYELANQPNPNSVANKALAGLFDGTNADAGAVLLLPRQKAGNTDPQVPEVLASRSDSVHGYQRVSKFLSQTVLREGEAVLARDVQDDSTLAIRDSRGVISATSVICAPIRVRGKTVGLIHLYSTDPSRILTPDGLEFTLAVAENVSQALKTIGKQQKLAEDLRSQTKELKQLREQLGVESEIIGSSQAMINVHQQIARAAPSKATVLIRGESGVGKELVARSVHFSSPRSKGPFVCLNCAALSETLLESELFGHEKGAFTGATDRKVGKFESAHRGTLMLDEIGEMSQSIQAKFLRVLEGHPFERVGGNKAIEVDVRVIAATNRDLEKEVNKGNFRRDLFFRLHVVEIHVPPLRKRTDDVIEIAEHFLEKFAADTGRRISGFSPAAIGEMSNYRWPGNVRELRNMIERGVLLARGNYIEPEDLSLSNLNTASESQELGQRRTFGYQPMSLADMEKQHILDTLRSTNWNKSRSASILGIERTTLDRKIKRYELAELKPEKQ